MKESRYSLGNGRAVSGKLRSANCAGDTDMFCRQLQQDCRQSHLDDRHDVIDCVLELAKINGKVNQLIFSSLVHNQLRPLPHSNRVPKVIDGI